MMLEVMEEAAREALAKCTKEEVIEVFINLCIKRDTKYIEGVREEAKIGTPESDAIVKVGMWMVMYHIDREMKKS